MIADRYDAFLFDLDGVLYQGAEPIEGAAGTLATLRSLGKGLAFMTNNSARAPDEVAAHLASVGGLARRRPCFFILCGRGPSRLG